MPALSQNLTFTINSTSSVSLNYPNTGTTALTYVTNRIKANGYYGSSDGLHTVQVKITEFIGNIEVQGTLASEPAESDWFAAQLQLGNSCVDTTGAIIENTTPILNYSTATSTIKIHNFTGNYIWLRAKVSQFTQGSVNSIQLNF